MATPSQSDTLPLSVIIPAYNETARLLPYLRTITAFLSSRGKPYEILVVDDGSTDDTAALVEKFRTQDSSVRLIRLPRNLGKGGAVRAGMKEARGEWRVLADADGAAPIEELVRLETAVLCGADLAIGSRFLASHDPGYRVQARWHRSVLGNLFNAAVRRLGIAGITDTQCGFKLFRDHAANDLFSLSRIDGYGFDLELLYIAQRRGYRIEEVPINWADQPGSKVRVLRDGLKMFRDLFSIRRNYKQGLYGKP